MNNYDLITEKEKNILEQYANGLSTFQIAKELQLNIGHVWTCRKQILQKTNYETITKAVAEYLIKKKN